MKNLENIIIPIYIQYQNQNKTFLFEIKIKEHKMYDIDNPYKNKNILQKQLISQIDKYLLDIDPQYQNIVKNELYQELCLN